MADSDPAKGRSHALALAGAGASTISRLASFRVTYIAFFVFAVLYVLSLGAAESLLDSYFRGAVARATRVSPADGPVTPQIQSRVGTLLHESFWTRIGRVRVNVFVLGADGRTPLYMGGRGVPPPPLSDPESAFREALRLLPATSEVVVSVPPDSVVAAGILVVYAAVLLQGLFFYTRAVARREAELLENAVAARDATAQRATSIERELTQVRQHLSQLEPSERAQAEEIGRLQSERQALRQKLGDLAEREAELRASASRSTELEQERQALEDLLEEAVEDLGQKEAEIRKLRDSLKRASKAAPVSGRGREAEHLARRMRTLYKDLEVDDRAIQDMVALRDESMKLKAEESLKRLADDPETAAVRRKVGGLPPHLSIFEMGFAGKGRIYYTRGAHRRYRVLAIGAKNTQKTDLEYLSRLSL